MSGNPFRRNAPNNVKLQAEERKVERAPSPFKVGKKKKSVKIQTPPQSPEEQPRRLSEGRISPPPPERASSSDDDSDTTATADSDIEQAVRNSRRNSGSLPPPSTLQQSESIAPSPTTTPGAGGAPYNPFARTLATSEAAFGLQKPSDGAAEDEPSKQGKGQKMNVDMFKNILLTGSPAPTPPYQPHQTQGHSSDSTTDSASVSKSSLFDQSYNLHPESPRSSFDHGDYSDEADDERGGLMGSAKERLDDFAPPAPPKAGSVIRPSKGPHTVSFAEYDNFSPTEEQPQSPANAAMLGKHRPHMLHRTGSDLNKPLPKTPPRSPGLPQEHPLSLDSQIAEPTQPATPVVTSPNESTKKAPPPPPPTSRRGGQAGTLQARARSTSDTRQEVEGAPESPQPNVLGSVPKSVAAPPPPPPSRKSKPAYHVSAPAVGTPASDAAPGMPLSDGSESRATAPPPTPAPRRNPSTKTGSSLHRSPSNASHSSALSYSNPAAPPAPPPRRKRESLDGAASSTSWAHRRSSQNSLESARSGSMSKPTLPSSEEAAQEMQSQQPEQTQAMQSDILADMSAFQAEIDALRKQAEKGG